MFKALFRSFVYKQANRNKRSLSSKIIVEIKYNSGNPQKSLCSLPACYQPAE